MDFRHKLINTKNGVIVLPRIDEATEVKIGTPDVRAEGTTQLFPIGTALIRDDGVYRYAKNSSAAAVTIGKLLQQAAVGNAAWIKDVAVAVTAAIGATSVTITTPAGDLTANQLKDGSLWVNDAATGGAVYKIKSHPAATAAASCVITLVDALEVALTAGTSTVGLRANLYDSVVVCPTTLTGVPVGWVNHSSFTASYYAWIKSKGLVAALTAGTVVVGNNVVPLTTAGAVGPSAGDVLPVVGVVMSVGATTEHSLVLADLDPSW